MKDAPTSVPEFFRRAAQVARENADRWLPGAAPLVAEWLEACGQTWSTQPVITITPGRARERRAGARLAELLLGEPLPRHPDE